MNDELWWKDFLRGPWEQVQLPGYPEQRTSTEAMFMIDALQVRSGARVLDIPCDEGRHAIELAQRGFDVMGIDFNEKAIGVAKHATEAKLDVSFAVADMRELAAVEEYDAVICFFGSFGYFGDDDNFEFLRRVARALRSGGASFWMVTSRNRCIRNSGSGTGPGFARSRRCASSRSGRWTSREAA